MQNFQQMVRGQAEAGDGRTVKPLVQDMWGMLCMWDPADAYTQTYFPECIVERQPFCCQLG